MVKVRGKKVKFTPSEYVKKDLEGVKRSKLKKKKAAAVNITKKPEEDNEIHLPETRQSDDVPVKTVHCHPIRVDAGRWRNKQRVLVFGSRGIMFRARHLMENLRRLLPHTKKEAKMDKKDKLFAINEISEMKNCNKCIFFEGRKLGDIYLWVSCIPEGPSVKFYVENASTMEELKFTGNCLKGSRALLSFDPSFDTAPHYKLLKEIFTQTFGTPYHHPKSQPFIDHVFTFTVLDNRIWFRNFQILEEGGSLVEIGPRFVLNPIRIFEGSFCGATLWNNPHYVSPNKNRMSIKEASAGKYMNKVQQKEEYIRKKPKSSYKLDPSDAIFQVNPDEFDED